MELLGETLGLEWQEIVLSPASCEDSAISVLRPPEEDLVVLRGLIATGQVSAICNWAKTLPLREVRFAAFASGVETAARQLDFSVLDRLARPEGR